MPAAIYARISQDSTGDRAGVERQEADCRALAEASGWTVAEVIADNDVSAYSGKPRPGYQRLLEMLRAREIDGVLAWHPDRLHRSPRELEDFIDVMEETGSRVLTVQAGAWDLSTPAGRMVARALGAVARYESEHKAERQRRKAQQLAMQGKVHGGGTRPFGFEADRLTIREGEAARIREAVEHVRMGGSLWSLLARWTAEGVPTVSGKPWRTQTLKGLLTRPRIAGLCEYRGEVVGEAEWPAIVEREAWEEVRASLAHPPRGASRSSPARKYLLTGIAVCGLCAARLVARPRPKGVRAYVCARGPNFVGCGKIRRTAEPVEELVRDQVLATLAGSGLAAAIETAAGDDADARRLSNQLRGYRQRLEELDTARWTEGTISEAVYVRQGNALRDRIRRDERALAQRPRRRALVGLSAAHPSDLRGWWESADLDLRRSLVALLVEQVVVHPAVKGRNTFDPSRIEVVWTQ